MSNERLKRMREMLKSISHERAQQLMDERTSVVEPFNEPASAEKAIERVNKPTSTPSEDRKR